MPLGGLLPKRHGSRIRPGHTQSHIDVVYTAYYRHYGLGQKSQMRSLVTVASIPAVASQPGKVSPKLLKSQSLPWMDPPRQSPEQGFLVRPNFKLHASRCVYLRLRLTAVSRSGAPISFHHVKYWQKFLISFKIVSSSPLAF